LSLISINDILKDLNVLGPQKSKIAQLIVSQDATETSVGVKIIKYVEISVQDLLFKNQECLVLNLRDVSKIREHSKLQVKNNLL
jgi:hypothetical protein